MEATIQTAILEARQVAKEQGISIVIVIGRKEGDRFSFLVETLNPQGDECPAWAIVALDQAARVMVPHWGTEISTKGCWFTVYGKNVGEEATIRSALKSSLRMHLIKSPRPAG